MACRLDDDAPHSLAAPLDMLVAVELQSPCAGPIVGLVAPKARQDLAHGFIRLVRSSVLVFGGRLAANVVDAHRLVCGSWARTRDLNDDWPTDDVVGVELVALGDDGVCDVHSVSLLLTADSGCSMIFVDRQ